MPWLSANGNNIFGLDRVNINVYANFYQNIRLVQELGLISLFKILTSATPRPNCIKMRFGETFGWAVSRLMCLQSIIQIFQNVQEIGPVPL